MGCVEVQKEEEEEEDGKCQGVSWRQTREALAPTLGPTPCPTPARDLLNYEEITP